MNTLNYGAAHHFVKKTLEIGATGLIVVKSFLQAVDNVALGNTTPLNVDFSKDIRQVKRVVVALDVRINLKINLIVTSIDITKGDFSKHNMFLLHNY